MHDDGSNGDERQRDQSVRSRAEKLADQWAGQIHAELLAAWAASDEDSPVPALADALAEARRRVAVLVAAVGELSTVNGQILDAPSNAQISWLTRGWSRNARPHDDGPDWSGHLFD